MQELGVGEVACHCGAMLGTVPPQTQTPPSLLIPPAYQLSTPYLATSWEGPGPQGRAAVGDLGGLLRAVVIN